MNFDGFTSNLPNREGKGGEGGDELLTRLIGFSRRTGDKILREKSCKERGVFGLQCSPKLLLDGKNLLVRYMVSRHILLLLLVLHRSTRRPLEEDARFHP